VTLRVLLVDDEPLGLQRIAAGFDGMSDVTVVGTAQDGDEAIEKIAALKPQLVILDIQMPSLTGLEVAAALEGPDRPEVVFVTAFDQYATDAFSVEAADYLLKPVKFDRLRLAVDRARRRRAMREADDRAAELESAIAALRAEAADPQYDTEFWVPTRQGLLRVPVASVDWIEAARDYVLLHTATRSHILRATMAALERKLDPTQLLRVHRSTFVRPSAVAEVQRQGKGLYALVLRDGGQIQVGPTYTVALLSALRLDLGRLETA
jgi:DNA-binding LytR/AlgR family response regulator